MIDATSLPFFVAQAPASGPTSFLVSMFPIALIVLVFYVLVLMPQRRRLKKVQEFQAALKVGDKVNVTFTEALMVTVEPAKK